MFILRRSFSGFSRGILAATADGGTKLPSLSDIVAAHMKREGLFPTSSSTTSSSSSSPSSSSSSSSSQFTPLEQALKSHTRARAGTLGAQRRKEVRPQHDYFEERQLEVNYKDVEVLAKFVAASGRILPRSVTGLSVMNQIKVAKAIKRARCVGLMPFVSAPFEYSPETKGLQSTSLEHEELEAILDKPTKGAFGSSFRSNQS